MTATQQLVSKIWNYCNILRDDGGCRLILKKAFEGGLGSQKGLMHHPLPLTRPQGMV